MPRVPQRQVGVAPLPGVRVSPNAPSAAFPGAAPATIDVSGVRQVVDRLHAEAVQRADQVAGLDNDNQLAQQAAQIEQQARARRGKDALGALDEANAAWSKVAASVVSGATTEQQRLFAQARAAMYGQRIQNAVRQHATSEMERYDDDTTTAALANRVDSAVASYDDPGAVQSALAETRAIVNDRARRMGVSDEVREQVVNANLAKIHLGVLGRMLDNQQDQAAAAYYDAHKDEIPGSDRGKIEKALEDGSTLGQAQRAADAILATPDVTATQAYEQARAITDPKVRQAAEQQIDAELSRRARAQSADRQAASERLISTMRENGGRLNRGSLDWQALKGTREGEHVLDVQREIQHPVDKGDPDKYLSFLSQAALSPQSRQQLAATPIEDIMRDPTMSAGQKSSVINLIRSAKQEARTAELSALRQQKTDSDAAIKDMQRTLKSRVDAEGNALSDEQATAMHRDLLDAQARAVVLDLQIKRARAGETLVSGTHTDGSAEPPAAAPTNPFGLSTAKPLTPDMEADIAKYGQGYADYLRSMGYAAPAVVPPVKQP